MNSISNFFNMMQSIQFFIRSSFFTVISIYLTVSFLDWLGIDLLFFLDFWLWLKNLILGFFNIGMGGGESDVIYLGCMDVISGGRCIDGE